MSVSCFGLLLYTPVADFKLTREVGHLKPLMLQIPKDFR